MGLEVDRLTNGYVASVTIPTSSTSWETPRPLAVEELIDELRKRGVDRRDIEDGVATADFHFTRGTTARVRMLRGIRHKFENGVIEKDDVDSVIRELLDVDSPIGKVFLVAALATANLPYHSREALLGLMRTTQNPDIVVTVLQSFADHDPQTFESEVKAFLERSEYAATRDAMPWILSMSGNVVGRGLAPSLLGEFIRLAQDQSQSEKTRKDARAAIAVVAGIDRLSLPVDLSASAFDQLVASARDALQLRRNGVD